MSTSIAPSHTTTTSHAHAIRTKQAEMESLSVEQASKKAGASNNKEIPPSTTTTNTTNTATKTSSGTVKVSNINVADERFHLSMIGLLGCVLSQLVMFEESQYPNGRGSISMFHTAYVPSISIGSYLKRIALYTKVSSEVLIQSVLHVHQLMQRSQNPLIVNKLNIHRLLLTSIMSTAKFFDDAHYNNSYFSFVGGVPLKELNALEVEFLSLLNFDFYVNTQTYQYFYSMVIEKNIHQNGCTCSSLLHGLPKSLPVSEYIPDADVLDFPEPWVEPVVSLSEVSPSSTGSTSSSATSMAIDDGDASMDVCGRSSSNSLSSSSSTTDSGHSSTPKQSSNPVIVVVVPPQPSGLLDDMGEELGSIRIEEDPMATSTEDEDDQEHATPRQQLAPTPKRLSAHHLQVHHSHSSHQYQQPQRSASPVSFLSSSSSLVSSHSSLSSTLESSPVSSSYASSLSSYPSSTCSRQQMHSYHHQQQQQQQRGGGNANGGGMHSGSGGGGALSSYPSHSSPSISLSSSSLRHSVHQRWGSSVVQEGEEDDEGEFLQANTPRLLASATPLAAAHPHQMMPDVHMLEEHEPEQLVKARLFAERDTPTNTRIM